LTSDELIERLINFAARVGKVVDALPDTRMGRHIGGQLVRNGTSPAPNYEEACAAESRADFVHKPSISLKELRESRCWIRLIIKTEMLPEHRMGEFARLNAINSVISSPNQLSPQSPERKRKGSNLQFAVFDSQFSMFATRLQPAH
jgi:four helix bundle protein